MGLEASLSSDTQRKKKRINMLHGGGGNHSGFVIKVGTLNTDQPILLNSTTVRSGKRSNSFGKTFTHPQQLHWSWPGTSSSSSQVEKLCEYRYRTLANGQAERTNCQSGCLLCSFLHFL